MIRSVGKFAFGASSLVLGIALAVGPAFAQGPTAGPTQAEDSEAADAGEIIVTARGFEERIQDVPIAISSLSAEDLQRQGLDDLGDIAEKTVGFAFESFTGPLAQPTIRGQTNLRTTSPVLNVATYLDGIYLQRAFLIDQGLIELDRIEIIKGPQSAIYGRNSFAGVINLASRKPDLERFTGKVSGTVGTDERYDARAMLSVPIIPGKLAVMGSAAYSTFDGTWRNFHPLANAKGANAFTRGNAGGYEKRAYQVAALAEFGVFRFDALYIHTKRELEQVPTIVVGTGGLTYPFNTLNCSPRGATPATTQNRLFCGALKPVVQLAPGETRTPGLVTVDPRAYGLRGPTDVASARLEVAPEGPFSAWAQFGYTYGKIGARGNASRDPSFAVPALGFRTFFDSSNTDSAFRSYSGEARANYEQEMLRVFAGVAYTRTRDIESNAGETGPVNSLDLPFKDTELFPIGPGLPFPSNLQQRRTYLERDEDIWSLYGFIEVKPTDQLAVSLEGRYTIEDQKITDFLVREPTNPARQSFVPPRDFQEQKFFTPRASVTYRFTPNNNVYATVARGVKSGGFNGVTSIPFVPQRRYEAETNWTYEVGSKNLFRDIGLTLNLAAYYTDWKNIQTNAARLLANGTSPPPGGIVSTVTGNVGAVKVYGAEIEGSWRVLRPLLIDFGASYNRSRYRGGTTSARFGIAGNCDNIVCPAVNPLPIGGNQLERVPEFDALLGLTYETTFANDWQMFVRGDVTYQTKQFADEANLAFVPARTLVNAAAGLDLGAIELNVWVKNLFDRKYVTSSLFLIGTAGFQSASYPQILGDQRTAGLTATFKF
jgi:iron complex outermembrane receptor protein